MTCRFRIIRSQKHTETSVYIYIYSTRLGRPYIIINLLKTKRFNW